MCLLAIIKKSGFLSLDSSPAIYLLHLLVSSDPLWFYLWELGFGLGNQCKSYALAAALPVNNNIFGLWLRALLYSASIHEVVSG